MSSSSNPVTVVRKAKACWDLCRSYLSKSAAALLMLGISTGSQAAVVENILQLNPKAFALGNAVSADYVGVDSVQYNPAALINLKPGFSTEFKLLGAPLAQVVRRTSPTLTPKFTEFSLFYRGYTVRCDSAYKPFAGVGVPSSISSNPGRDPVSGGLDPSVPGLNYNIPGDVCFGPELVNPNGIFLNDPLDSPSSDLDRTVPIPLLLPFYLPNIGYKASEDSRVAFAAQVFSNAPLPTLDLGGSINILSDLGIQRLTVSPAMAFQVTDKLSVGGALRISKSRLQVGVYLDGQSQLFGFLNAAVNDLCKTNESRKNSSPFSPDGGAERLYDDYFNCAQLYRVHQERVDAGKARESGYWPFLPWDSVADVIVKGETPLIYSWNLGVQWQPMPWLKWGATYRSKEDDVYETSGRVYYSPGLVSIFSGLRTVPVLGALSTLILDGSASDAVDVDVNVPWPAAFSTGVSMQLLEKTKLNIEYRRYNYADWENWDATITSAEVNAVGLLGLLSSNNVGNTIGIPAGGVNTSYYAYGVEHQWNKRLALRMGLEDRPFLGEGGFIPLYGIRMFSIGSEYKLTHDKVVDVTLTSMKLDATSPPSSGKTLAEDPLAILTLRGAEYQQRQLDVNVLLFSAKYTHRF